VRACAAVSSDPGWLRAGGEPDGQSAGGDVVDDALTVNGDADGMRRSYSAAALRWSTSILTGDASGGHWRLADLCGSSGC
jgi:hypothetical protein